MKKIFFAMSISLLLAACSTDEQASDIYNKAVAASDEIENVEIEMVIDQQIGGDSIPNGESAEDSEALDAGIPITTTSTAKIQIEPLALHQTVKVMGMSLEMYYGDQGLFMQGMGEDTWYKLESDELDLLTQQMDEVKNQTPVQQLDMFEEYMDDFSYEEHEDRYVLRLNTSDLDINKLMKEQFGSFMSEELFTEEMMESIAINQLNYEITLDKSTYYVSSISMDMDMTITDNGEETSISQKANLTYTKYNEVGDIEIPEEIINNAETF